jgi:hypothetical protein
MTSAVETASPVKDDLRTILGGGVLLGLLTAVGVVLFALLSRALSGTAQTVVQALLILAGGAVFSYLPAFRVRPREVDSIAWAALIGLLGALTFTVLDIVLLRPLGVYHWTWDQIGGGSGFWYIPVWWMGSANLAWLGAWIYAIANTRRPASAHSLAVHTLLIAVGVFVILTVVRLAPFTSAIMALSFCLALLAQLSLTAALRRG